MTLIMSERQFNFNEKTEDAFCVHHKRLCEDQLTITVWIFQRLFQQTVSGEVMENIRPRGLLWVSHFTSINKAALGSSFHKQTPSVILVPLKVRMRRFKHATKIEGFAWENI